MYRDKFPIDWEVPGFDADGLNGPSNKVIVAYDCEYRSGVTTTIPIGGHDQEASQRRLEDIISIQLAFNYENREPVQYFLHRDQKEPAFRFYDLIKLLKEYLSDVADYPALKQQIPTFTIELWTFWGGVDITAFADVEKILSEYKKDKNAISKVVTMHGNTVFTSRPINLIVKTRQNKPYKLFKQMRLTMRDMTKLAPGKSNLEALGTLLNVPKLDTEAWDRQDGLTEGYYKAHMNELWQKRQSDFIAYAMRDVVITALYGSFILKFQAGLSDEDLGKFVPAQIKTSLGAIAANIIAERNSHSADWIVEIALDTVRELSVNEKDCIAYLEPICAYRFNPITKARDYDFDELFFAGATDATTREWLTQHLDFDAIRKGYRFPRTDITDDSNHKHLVNDIKNRIDLPQATLFNDAANAYVGGYNVVLVPGIIPKGGYKVDIDLKAAYNTSGHVLPDIAPGLGNEVFNDIRNIPEKDFETVVRYAEAKLNGPYTVGVGVFNITYPKDYRGFVITPKIIDDGPRYLLKQDEVTLSFTDAYTAWSCGAKVFTHRLSFPYQAKMDPAKMNDICSEGIVQDVFQQRRNRYPNKQDPMNVMNKNVGNQSYGVTGQGIKEKRSRDYGNGQSYYIPFSQATSPLKAMQFTAITRLHITLLQRAIWQVDPAAVFLNNVTDGCLVYTQTKLNFDAVAVAMNKLVDDRYRQAVQANFNGVYFEEKEGSSDDTANLRTRLTFSRDNELKAMVGINQKKLKPEDVFTQYLDQNAIQIPVENRMISGLVDMRHQLKFQHLQTSWIESSSLYLGYDFAQWLTSYQSTGKFVLWSSQPYESIDQYRRLQHFGRTLIKYGPFYSAEYAPFFQRTLDEYAAGFKPRYFGEFIKADLPDEDNPKRVPYRAEEVYVNWLRYVIREARDTAEAYETIDDLIADNGWAFHNKGELTGIPQFDSFKKYIQRHKNNKKEMINYVLLHRVGLI